MHPELANAIDIVKQKSPDALDHALALLQGTVLKYSLQICKQREDAEDTAQEVLLRTARFLHNFDNAMALSVWLYRVAKTQCSMSRRRSKFAPTEQVSLDDSDNDRAIALIEQIADENRPSAQQIILRIETAEQILAAIRKLPEPYREVLTLHDLEELDTEKLAEVLGISEGAVRVRLHRARTMLKQQLSSIAEELTIP